MTLHRNLPQCVTAKLALDLAELSVDWVNLQVGLGWVKENEPMDNSDLCN